MAGRLAATMAEQGAGEKFRLAQVGRQTIVYGLGLVLSKLASFLMLPIYTHLLTPADYGVIQLVEMTFDIISILAGASIAVGVFRFYYKAETEEARSSMLSTSLIIILASYTVLAAVVFLNATAISSYVFRGYDHSRLIQIAALTFPFQGLLLVPLAYLRVRDLSLLFVGANIVRLLVQLTLNLVFLVHLDMGAESVFLSNLFASMLVSIVLAGYMLTRTGLKFSASASRDLVRFGTPLIATQVATFFVTFGDRYFLEGTTTEADVGIYSLAYQFGFLLVSLGFQPFIMVWEPLRFEIAKRWDRDQVFTRAFLYMNILLVTLAVGIALFVSDVLMVLSAPSFHPAAALVPLILAAHVVQTWASFHDVGIHIAERTIYITAANWVSAGVSLLGYLILIPAYHLWGAAVTSLVALLVRWLLIYTFSQRLWPVRYDWGPVLRLLVLGTTVVLAGVVLPDMTVFFSIGARVVLVIAFLAGVWTLGVLSAVDRSRLREMMGDPRRLLGGSTAG